MSARLIYMQGGNSNRLHSTGKGYFMAHTKNSKIFEILQGYCKTLNVRWDLSSRFWEGRFAGILSSRLVER